MENERESKQKLLPAIHLATTITYSCNSSSSSSKICVIININIHSYVYDRVPAAAVRTSAKNVYELPNEQRQINYV
jgi:hypothetical protein